LDVYVDPDSMSGLCFQTGFALGRTVLSERSVLVIKYAFWHTVCRCITSCRRSRWLNWPTLCSTSRWNLIVSTSHRFTLVFSLRNSRR